MAIKKEKWLALKGLCSEKFRAPASMWEKIFDDYHTYCIMDYGPFGEEIRPPKKKMDTFHEGDQPSQFMIDFIKATHDLFQNQKKRIDELETIIHKSNINNKSY